MASADSSGKPTSGFVVTVQFDVHPEHREAFMREMVANARASREREPGCKVFDVCEDPAHPGQVFLYEIYEDAAAFQLHLKAAHFLEFDRTVKPWVTQRQIKLLSLVDR